MPGSAHCPMRLAACASRHRGMAQSHAPPTPDTGEQPTCPGGAPPLPPGLTLMSLWGPGGVTPVYYPSGGPDRCQHPLFLLERGLHGSSGPPGFGYRVCATRSETYLRMSPLPWSPLSVPSYPPRRGGGPVHPPSHPPHRCFDMHCTQCTMCVPAPAPCVAWVRAVRAS